MKKARHDVTWHGGQGVIATECGRGACLLDQLAKEMGGSANGLSRSAQGNNP